MDPYELLDLSESPEERMLTYQERIRKGKAETIFTMVDVLKKVGSMKDENTQGIIEEILLFSSELNFSGEKIRELHNGKRSEVLMIKKDGLRVCAKAMLDYQASQVPDEISIAIILGHSCPDMFVGVRHYFNSFGLWFMVMDYYQHTLADMVGKLETREDLTYILRQVGEAIEYMHSIGIAHRDLKQRNVLVTRDLTARVADFGLAVRFGSLEKEENMFNCTGTPFFKMPECEVGIPHKNSHADVWAFGIMSFVLITTKSPFHRGSAWDVIRKQRVSQLEVPLIGGFNRDVGDFFEAIFCPYAAIKLSMAEVLKLPFLANARRFEKIPHVDDAFLRIPHVERPEYVKITNESSGPDLVPTATVYDVVKQRVVDESPYYSDTLSA